MCVYTLNIPSVVYYLQRFGACNIAGSPWHQMMIIVSSTHRMSIRRLRIIYICACHGTSSVNTVITFQILLTVLILLTCVPVRCVTDCYTSAHNILTFYTVHVSNFICD